LIVKGRELEASDAFIFAAADAVKQWQYEPPADPPVSFDVTIAFRADGTSRLADDRGATGRLTEPYSAAGPSPALNRPPIKIKHVAPTYPPEAIASGISGVVVIEARIDTDGRIREARVLRSVAGLDEAALAAVRQWEYETPLVNGVPAPVVTTLTIAFTLPVAR
jgi:protein TonB